VAGSGPHCRALASSSERDLLQVTTAEAFPGEQVLCVFGNCGLSGKSKKRMKVVHGGDGAQTKIVVGGQVF
jgi:hypothetical protein